MGRKIRDEEVQRDEGEPPAVITTRHKEVHRSARGPVMRDIIIGGADGLTVPFALTAGLSSYAFLHLSILARRY